MGGDVLMKKLLEVTKAGVLTDRAIFDSQEEVDAYVASRAKSNPFGRPGTFVLTISDLVPTANEKRVQARIRAGLTPERWTELNVENDAAGMADYRIRWADINSRFPA